MTGTPEIVGAWYRVVHEMVWVRGGPSIAFKVTGAKEQGAVVAVSAVRDGWVKLADGAGWMLIDGSGFGLGALLQRLHEQELPEGLEQNPIVTLDTKCITSGNAAAKAEAKPTAARRRRGFTERLSEFRCSEKPLELPDVEVPSSAASTTAAPTPQRSSFNPAARRTPASRARSAQARKRCPPVQDAVAVKILVVLVAPAVEGHQSVEALKHCVESVAEQEVLPRALWVSWHSQANDIAIYTQQMLEDVAFMCLRRGITLSQVQHPDSVAPWQHVQGVLEKRRLMGGDICNVWALIGYPTTVWRPQTFRLLSAAASQAASTTQAVCSASCEEADADAAADALHMQLALIRMPALAEFIAGLPEVVLQHAHCDLAYHSFLRHLGTGWPLRVECITKFALENSKVDDVHFPCKPNSLLEGAREAPWAYALCSAELERLFRACHLATTALVLACFFQEACDPILLPELSTSLATAFELDDLGMAWTESCCRELLEDTLCELGRPHKPTDEEIGRLLRSGKLKAASDVIPKPADDLTARDVSAAAA